MIQEKLYRHLLCVRPSGHVVTLGNISWKHQTNVTRCFGKENNHPRVVDPRLLMSPDGSRRDGKQPSKTHWPLY